MNEPQRKATLPLNLTLRQGSGQAPRFGTGAPEPIANLRNGADMDWKCWQKYWTSKNISPVIGLVFYLIEKRYGKHLIPYLILYQWLTYIIGRL